jgi:NAD(P)-dependent dehydrogenase (short-subunit alcohol dehydrogenase family)
MVNSPILAAYGVSKAAAWSLTNGLRQELREQGTQVMGVHAGFIDTDLTRGFDAPKSRPEDVVRQTLDALEAGVDALGEGFDGQGFCEPRHPLEQNMPVGQQPD